LKSAATIPTSILIVHFIVDGGPVTDPARTEKTLAEHMRRAQEVSSKPIAAVIHPPRAPDGMAMQGRLYQQLSDMGVGSFRSFDECAAALRRFIDWRDSTA
jgi:hypothetical protein